MFSIIVYSTIFASFLFAGIKVRKQKVKYWGIIIIPILLFSLIEGNRIKVGVDWQHYVNLYYDCASGFESNTELIFTSLSQLFYNVFGFEYWSIFFTMAFFLTFGAMFYGRKHIKVLYISAPLFISMFTNTSETLSRQFAALGICLITAYYFLEGQYKKAIICNIIAFLFHSSSFVFLPICLFIKFLSNREFNIFYIYIVAHIFITFFFNVLNITPYIYSQFNIIGQYIGKDFYVNNQDLIMGHLFILEDDQSKFLKAMNFITTLSIIIYGNKIRKIRNNWNFTFLYHIIIIGNILMPAFYTQELLKRMLYYFTIFTPFIIGELANNSLQLFKKKMKTNFWTWIFFIIILYNFYRYFAQAIAKSGLWNLY